MTRIQYTILVYSTTSAVMTAAVRTPLTLANSFPTAIADIEANAPDSQVYLQGYNKKCLVGLQ